MNRPSRVARLSAAILLLSSAACEQDELEIVEVETATNDGNVVFSWASGNAHGLTVSRCLQECNGCVDGVPDYGGAEVIWEAAEYPTGPADLVSPLTYGESPGGGSAQALVSGVTYGVNGYIERVSDRVWLFTPSTVQVTIDHSEAQPLRPSGPAGSPAPGAGTPPRGL